MKYMSTPDNYTSKYIRKEYSIKTIIIILDNIRICQDCSCITNTQIIHTIFIISSNDIFRLFIIQDISIIQALAVL